MDLNAQLNAAGLELISGNMRLMAALGAGIAAEATDGQGNNYRISVNGGKLSVEKLEKLSEQGLLPVAIVRSADPCQPSMSDFQIPLEAVGPCPANARLTKFSFRAECQPDVTLFLGSIQEAGYDLISTVHADPDGYPDVEVEMQTNATLEHLQGILRGIEDSHVMLQTLRQVPLDVNPLERDYDLI